jgi:hypothetical protein
MHSHPASIQQIYRALLKLGVTVNKNPFHGKNYPFKPQGIAVVQLVTA